MAYPKSLRAGGDKYGVCEVCNKYMDTAYIAPIKEGVDYLFGHKECLEGNNNGKRIKRLHGKPA